ncbi:MAG: MBL fold metallo-hydrolase [Solobacterium sp.]|nr:MBL fold metallo-hydrolase [Solobacterium sp.]
MPTHLFPVVQIRKGFWEIDEFEISSCFLIEGPERALLIDTGQGIGDLRTCVEMLTKKPVTVVLTHNHADHIGNAYQWDEVWIHPNDRPGLTKKDVQRAKNSAAKIAKRQKGCFDGVYKMFRLEPYDLNDVQPSEDKELVIHDLADGMEFDLGGGRIITCYECFGHSKGEVVFLDNQERILIAGDALNYNLGVSAVPVETTLRFLKRLQSMSDRYDAIYNNHHDMRAFGAPLDDDCLPTAIAILEDVMDGHIVPVQIPSFWGQDLPLSAQDLENNKHPKMGDGRPSNRTTLRRGRNFVGIDVNNIYEEKK